MSRERVFVVRETSFFYTDEYYALGGAGRVRGVYATREEAESVRTTYQRQRVRQDAITDYVFDDREAIDAVVKVFQEHFPDEDIDSTGGYFQQSVRIPRDATDEQVDAVLAAMGVDFATVFEMDASQPFFAIRVQPHRLGDPEAEEEAWLCDSDGQTLFESREDCCRQLGLTLCDRRLQLGPPETLTDVPELLQALLASGKLVYDAATGTLTGDEDADYAGLLALLKDPPARIVEIPLTSAHRPLEPQWPPLW